jgi:hypothetical protein
MKNDSEPEFKRNNYEEEKELIELRHKYKVEELAIERENNRLFHERELEKIRIKSAEIFRSQVRKERGAFKS